MIYSHIHVPKAAGSTLRDRAKRSFGESSVLYLGDGTLKEKPTLRQYVSERDLETVRFATGHMNCFGLQDFFSEPLRYVVFLREPKERLLSYYRYMFQRPIEAQEAHGIVNSAGEVTPFLEWVEQHPRTKNGMVKFLYERMSPDVLLMDDPDLNVGVDHLNYVKEHFEEFWAVGLSDDPAHLDTICNEAHLGLEPAVSNATKNRQSVEVDDQALNRFINLDQELYTFAKEQIQINGSVILR